MTSLLALALVLQSQAQQGDVRGGAAAIKALESAPAKTSAASSAVRLHLEAFLKVRDTLAPEVAAQQWLALAVESDKSRSLQQMSFGIDRLLDALPGPASWPFLQRLASANASEPSNRKYALLGAALTGDMPSILPLLDKVSDPYLAKPVGAMSYPINTILDYKLAFALRHQDLAAVDSVIAAWVSLKADVNSTFPQLVPALSEARAREIYRTLLTQSNQTFSLPYDAAAKKLVVSVLRECVGQLKKPQWNLISSDETADLFPEMAKHATEVPAPEGGDYASLDARAHYAFWLFLQGQPDAALAALKQGPRPGQNSLMDFGMFDVKASHPRRYEFLDLLADKYPAALDWNEYVVQAIGHGKEDHALEGLKSMMGKPGANKDHALDGVLVKALMALDRVEEAATEIRRQIAASQENPAEPESRGPSKPLTLFKLGYVAHRMDWVKEALSHMNPGTELMDSGFAMEHFDFATALVNMGLAGEAESRILSSASLTESPEGHQDSLVQLVKLYRSLNRPADLLQVVEGAHTWQCTDLSQIYFNSMGSMSLARQVSPSFGAHIAWALAEVGRKEEAYKVALPSLYLNGGYDDAYLALIDAKGADALPILDDLYKRDPFEERPLIWKAEELRRLGRLKEAEETARAAIAVDPSDGDEPHGDRMRGYAVLASILKAKGSADQAKEMEDVVKAIRMSEEADDLMEDGLVKRAIQRYSDSLQVFGNAYCIQSRLAIQLARQGNSSAALEHFKKAFELMPSSFGRVETHCFGCEGTFSDKDALKIAAQVLTDAAAKNPNNPQTHYLLGYISADNEALAIKEFQRAVELDPLYLNAWVHLVNYGKQLPKEFTEKAFLTLLHLDPSQRHVALYGEFIDVKPEVAWNAIQALPPATFYRMPDKIFPLGAKEAAQSSRYTEAMAGFRGLNGPERVTSPGIWAAKVGEVAPVVQLLRILEQTALDSGKPEQTGTTGDTHVSSPR